MGPGMFDGFGEVLIILAIVIACAAFGAGWLVSHFVL